MYFQYLHYTRGKIFLILRRRSVSMKDLFVKTKDYLQRIELDEIYFFYKAQW